MQCVYQTKGSVSFCESTVPDSNNKKENSDNEEISYVRPTLFPEPLAFGYEFIPCNKEFIESSFLKNKTAQNAENYLADTDISILAVLMQDVCHMNLLVSLMA